MEKRIYELKLHERISDVNIEVMRVPGGWIYRYWDYSRNVFDSPVFVPYTQSDITINKLNDELSEEYLTNELTFEEYMKKHVFLKK